MSSNEKILMMRLNSLNLPHSIPNKLNSSNNSNEAAASCNNNDVVFYLDSSGMENAVKNPSFIKLIDKINANIDLESARKKLDLDEKVIQISILEEEKNYKTELNKYDLMQKSFDIKKKTSDFEYQNKLRDLLLDSINNGDFHKASYLNLCLNNQSDLFNSYFNNQNTLSGSSMNQVNSNVFNDLTHANNITNMINPLSDEEESEMNEDANSSNNNNNNNNNGMFNTELGEVISNQLNDNNDENQNDNIENSNDLVDKFKTGLTPSSNNLVQQTMFINKLSLANKNIRHLICSTSKLEDYSTSTALTILFKGKCFDSDICHRKEAHTHYLIDCTNCRRHISLYFQTAKYGLKFYKTYQIKSQAELDKIIRTFRMKSIRE